MAGKAHAHAGTRALPDHMSLKVAPAEKLPVTLETDEGADVGDSSDLDASDGESEGLPLQRPPHAQAAEPAAAAFHRRWGPICSQAELAAIDEVWCGLRDVTDAARDPVDVCAGVGNADLGDACVGAAHGTSLASESNGSDDSDEGDDDVVEIDNSGALDTSDLEALSDCSIESEPTLPARAAAAALAAGSPGKCADCGTLMTKNWFRCEGSLRHAPQSSPRKHSCIRAPREPRRARCTGGRLVSWPTSVCRCAACGRIAHVGCWVRHLRLDQKGHALPPSVLLPDQGSCPDCSAPMTWLDVLMRSESLPTRQRRRKQRRPGASRRRADNSKPPLEAAAPGATKDRAKQAASVAALPPDSPRAARRKPVKKPARRQNARSAIKESTKQRSRSPSSEHQPGRARRIVRKPTKRVVSRAARSLVAPLQAVQQQGANRVGCAR